MNEKKLFPLQTFVEMYKKALLRFIDSHSRFLCDYKKIEAVTL